MRAPQYIIFLRRSFEVYFLPFSNNNFSHVNWKSKILSFPSLNSLSLNIYMKTEFIHVSCFFEA